MILGMSLATFTVVHTILSLIGIVTGLVVLLGMLGGRKLDSWTAIFLATTVLTSVTGFFFPVVPKGRARIRTQMSAAHSFADVDKAIAAFIEAGKEFGVV